MTRWDVTWHRVQNYFKQTGAKCRQEEATDEACKSPTLLNNVRANNRAILRIVNFSEADSKGSERVPDNPSRTTERSQKGTRELQIGLSHLATWRKWDTRGFCPTEAPLIWLWHADIAATYPLSLAGDNPAERRSCRSSSTEPIGQWTRSAWCCAHHDSKRRHFRALSFLVDGALAFKMVSTTSDKPEWTVSQLFFHGVPQWV